MVDPPAKPIPSNVQELLVQDLEDLQESAEWRNFNNCNYVAGDISQFYIDNQWLQWRDNLGAEALQILQEVIQPSPEDLICGTLFNVVREWLDEAMVALEKMDSKFRAEMASKRQVPN